jgi:hypothetical protein
MIRFSFLILLFLLLSSCASKEERRLNKLKFQEKVASKTDYELCQKVRITNWPPTWRGGKGVFWYITEVSYREELIRRGVTPFLCSNASKNCVSYGMEFKSDQHRSCTINEGRNIASIRANEKQRDYDYLQSIQKQQVQPDFVTPYLRKIERIDPNKRNSQGQKCLHRPTTC